MLALPAAVGPQSGRGLKTAGFVSSFFMSFFLSFVFFVFSFFSFFLSFLPMVACLVLSHFHSTPHFECWLALRRPKAAGPSAARDSFTSARRTCQRRFAKSERPAARQLRHAEVPWVYRVRLSARCGFVTTPDHSKQGNVLGSPKPRRKDLLRSWPVGSPRTS